jgi:hypothetical protein
MMVGNYDGNSLIDSAVGVGSGDSHEFQVVLL